MCDNNNCDFFREMGICQVYMDDNVKELFGHIFYDNYNLNY